MPRFDFVVTLETDTREQAEIVLAEQLDAEVEYDFECTIWGWEISGDPDGYGDPILGHLLADPVDRIRIQRDRE